MGLNDGLMGWIVCIVVVVYLFVSDIYMFIVICLLGCGLECWKWMWLCCLWIRLVVGVGLYFRLVEMRVCMNFGRVEFGCVE